LPRGKQKVNNGWEKYYDLFKRRMLLGTVLRCPRCRNKLSLDMDFRKTDLTFKCHRCGHKYKKPLTQADLEPDWMIKSRFGKKRKLRDDQFWQMDKIVHQIKSHRLGIVPDKVKRNCALVAFLFLTGARISEVVGMDKPLPKKQRTDKDGQRTTHY